jgi:hypothetical protein
MSSENGRKSESSDSGPASNGPRSNARVASAWGAARDALAAVRNLETLLRSATVPDKTLVDLVPELRETAGVLREAFDRSRAGDPATAAVGAHGQLQVDTLDELLDRLVEQTSTRGDLARRAGLLADELAAAVELLVLLDRAAAPLPTEVTLVLVAREMGRMSGSAHGRELIVRFDEARPDRAVQADPNVLGPLLALLVAWCESVGHGALVLRAKSVPGALFVIETATPADAHLPTLSLRAMPWISPSEAAARHVAAQLHATLTIESGPSGVRATVAIPAD